jgi:diguanylate cyclase (GGDEF)-like protein
MLHPDGRDALFQKFDEAIQNKTPTLMYSYRIKHKDGHYIWREDSTNFRYTNTGDYDGAYVVSRDITERRRLEEEVRQLAYFDPLTQLPNRRMLSDRLGQSIAACKRSRLHAAVMVLDLDNFKPLNDQHGHLVGDLLLVEVARRLLACVREVDTVARFGGDEFVVVLNDLDEDQAESRRRVHAVAEKIRLELEVPYLLSFKNGNLATITIEHHCSASIGVALFLNHEADQSEILKWADAAMYQAKEAGRNTIRFHCSTK